jgi:hypothetical protein
MPPLMQYKQDDPDVNPKPKVTLMMSLEVVFTTILCDSAGFLQNQNLILLKPYYSIVG